MWLLNKIRGCRMGRRGSRVACVGMLSSISFIPEGFSDIRLLSCIHLVEHCTLIQGVAESHSHTAQKQPFRPNISMLTKMPLLRQSYLPGVTRLKMQDEWRLMQERKSCGTETGPSAQLAHAFQGAPFIPLPSTHI